MAWKIKDDLEYFRTHVLKLKKRRGKGKPTNGEELKQECPTCHRKLLKNDEFFTKTAGGNLSARCRRCQRGT